MKAKITPLFFEARDGDFDLQLSHLQTLFQDEVEFLKETSLGSPLPEGTEAILFPQLLGETYSRYREILAYDLPIMIITSEFGTLSMWDWEIIEFLRAHGLKPLAPYDTDQARIMFRAVRVRNELRRGTFLVYQDNPGEGQQAGIFKRFWWWEKECRAALAERFGVTIAYRSYRELGKRLTAIPDETARREWRKWDYPTEGLSENAILEAVKLYLAVAEDIEREDNVYGVGINCLNESHFSATTPCLAWDMLYSRSGIMWACEADVVSLVTKCVLHHSLQVATVMTNIYPFLMGMAALKHEKVPSFPEIVDNPDDHILVGHCGYFALAPRSMCSSWCLRPSVLGIVDKNSHAMDARFPAGPVTLAKLDPYFRRVMVIPGTLKGYVSYPGSDCRNGGVIEVSDGHELMRRVYSHHQCVLTGNQARAIRTVADVFGLEVEGI